MDFASTYEPIDWNALNDFANRARQDAKDNADMVNEAKKSMLNVVSDPNAYVTEEGNKLVNQSLTDLSGIDLNASPADAAKKTSGMVNTAKGITDAINKNAEIRRKSLENMSYSQDDLQLVDAFHDGGHGHPVFLDAGLYEHVDKGCPASQRVDLHWTGCCVCRSVLLHAS
jgi:hypothetical protein